VVEALVNTDVLAETTAAVEVEVELTTKAVEAEALAVAELAELSAVETSSAVLAVGAAKVLTASLSCVDSTVE
jgi:xanthine dehydrogenase iron-sulfur cluster and FAD-binding subunit A